MTQQEWWRRLATLERQQQNLLQQARNCAPDDPFTTALRTSYNDLESQKAAAAAEIASFESAASEESLQQHDDEVLMARWLVEAIQLTVRLHDYSGQPTISIRIPNFS